MSTLLSPVKLGALRLANRVVMAPLTRTRTEHDHLPNQLMAEYYAQRASAGLIIAEATMIMPGLSAFNNEPGIYSPEQIAAWKNVTDAVHDKGGKMAVQLWHGGRACHPDMNADQEAVAASAIAITNEQAHTPTGKKPYSLPRELNLDEIKHIVAGFKQAAINAEKAGFDAIELHGANGYLIDNFLRDGANKRQDQYGGSLENRARFLFEVLDAIAEVYPLDKVGLRISPLNQFNSMSDSDPVSLTEYLCHRLNDYNLAYLHIMRHDFFGNNSVDVLSPALKVYQGNIVANMGYSQEEAEQTVNETKVAAVAFGMAYIANPDLVQRFARALPLNEADSTTFYSPGAKGYTDYPLFSTS